MVSIEPVPPAAASVGQLAAARVMFQEGFEARVLPFDTTAADADARVTPPADGQGRASAAVILLIATVARSHGANVITHNLVNFADYGIVILAR